MPYGNFLNFQKSSFFPKIECGLSGLKHTKCLSNIKQGTPLSDWNWCNERIGQVGRIFDLGLNGLFAVIS